MIRHLRCEPVLDSELEDCFNNVESLVAAKIAAEQISGTNQRVDLAAVRIIEIFNRAADEGTCSARLILNSEGIFGPACPLSIDACPYQAATES